ncbi:uncharacterized protein LAESUDRAFT_685041 [Laetiporus sulphureus 93-53]|uniref:Uncharacterized protein n=1 Tax=Laetiporus sulphureus 93-53 TaxID=1314785 RepID=A0A165CG70_9APHY|nr:uncharacterized protein LAESUDRAFT_685041 [Laetiporus sulphureus 93-53]KZT02751.1 hypothetical protein LAESUDRAFT_685041 [Laetiporus sulphureus 93-53]
MIAGLSRAITTLLAPLLSLAAFLLILFAYLAPTLMLSMQVSLLKVSSSTALTSNSTVSSVDGPTIFLGALGSCSRANNEATVSCTVPSVSPTYNLSVLPSNAPDIFDTPTTATPAFIAVSLAFTVVFLFMYTFTAHHAILGRAGVPFERPQVQRATAWIGLLGFIIGITSFLIIFMWFTKSVDDFNEDIKKLGSDAPNLIATTSNGFVMAWIGYAFYAVPLASSLAKLQVTVGGKA